MKWLSLQTFLFKFYWLPKFQKFINSYCQKTWNSYWILSWLWEFKKFTTEILQTFALKFYWLSKFEYLRSNYLHWNSIHCRNSNIYCQNICIEIPFIVEIRIFTVKILKICSFWKQTIPHGRSTFVASWPLKQTKVSRKFYLCRFMALSKRAVSVPIKITGLRGV